MWHSRPRLCVADAVGVAEPAEGGWSTCRTWLSKPIGCRRRFRLFLLFNTQLGQLLGDVGTVFRGLYVLVDVENFAVLADVKRPPVGKAALFVEHAVIVGGFLVGVAENRKVEIERFGEFLIYVGRIDAGRKIGDLELPQIFATRTE